MISRTPTLAEWPSRTVRLARDLCPRRGQYRKETLIARFGGGVLMPDVRHLIAECPQQGRTRCGVGGALCGFAWTARLNAGVRSHASLWHPHLMPR
jgi:hypothetical protein